MLRLNYPVILASTSPRRLELLGRLVPEFKVVPADIDEDPQENEDPWVLAQRLARDKALAVAELHSDCLVIGSDTVVALPHEDAWLLYSKPIDKADAKRMLNELSGQTHRVITGVAIRWPKGFTAFTETTEVEFRTLSNEDIDRYIATGEPMDKAGSYGLQDSSQNFIAQVRGSVTNVIGLPLEKFEEVLREIKS